MTGLRVIQAAAWLCLGVCVAGHSDVSVDFKLVDENGRDVLAEAAAHDFAHGFRPSARTLELSFTAHNRSFDYRLHRQTVSPTVGEVFSYSENGTLTRSALDEHLYFRSPSNDAVLTIVGRSFRGTVRVGSKVFDVEHEHGSPTLEVEHVTHLSGEVSALHPNGSMAYSAPDGRRLQTPTKWSGCWSGMDDNGPMMAFKIGVIITSTVYKHYNWKSKAEAQEWIQDIITRANTAYHAQLHVHLQLGSLVVQDTPSGAPSWDNPNCHHTISQQLQELGKWFPVDTSVGIWHLFGDCFNWRVGGTIGLAYIGVLCWPNGGMNYNNGVSWISDKHVAQPTYHTFAHEVGHNFGAQHSFEEGQGRTGGIMDYGVNGMLDGMHQFNEKYRRNEICGHINSKLGHCPAFSPLVAGCGNGVVEPGEDCECADGSTTCQGCCSCKTSLQTGVAVAECSSAAVGHGGCCTSSGLFAEVGANCSLSGIQGYCMKGQCVIESACSHNTMYDGYCGLEDGCKLRCISAADGTCVSVSGVKMADGSSINNLPAETPCKDSSGMVGKCSATGTCFVGVSIEFANTLEPQDPNPYSTETNITGCVGFADRGFLGRADAVWYAGKSLDDCNLECLNSPKCHSFVHYQGLGFCELWSRHQLDQDLAVVPGYDTYICDLRAAGFDFLDAFIYENTNVVTKDVPPRPRSQSSGMTRSTCYKTCATDPGCHVFVYGKEDKSCQLYSSEVSETQFDPTAESYDTYLMPCHGRDQICECNAGPKSKIRQPCQCNSVSSPYENECDIDQYCYDGICSDTPKRRLEATDYCPSTGAPTVSPTASPTFAPTSTLTSVTTTVTTTTKTTGTTTVTTTTKTTGTTTVTTTTKTTETTTVTTTTKTTETTTRTTMTTMTTGTTTTRTTTSYVETAAPTPPPTPPPPTVTLTSVTTMTTVTTTVTTTTKTTETTTVTTTTKTTGTTTVTTTTKTTGTTTVTTTTKTTGTSTVTTLTTTRTTMTTETTTTRTTGTTTVTTMTTTTMTTATMTTTTKTTGTTVTVPTPPPTPSPTHAPTSTGTSVTTVTTTVTSRTTTSRTTTSRTTFTFTATSITTTTTTQKFVVNVGMELKSTGTEEEVESATVDMAARKHNVAKDQVIATASAIAAARRMLGRDRKLDSSASYVWKVAYELILQDVTKAEEHLHIAQTLQDDPDTTKDILQQSFQNAGLTVDTSDMTLEVPTQVKVHQYCYDTNFGILDPFDDDCTVYKRDPDLCGNWDDADFSSTDMCCACGGGSDSMPTGTTWAPPPVMAPEEGCTSTDDGAKDNTGDGCSVYEKDPARWCGEFDTEDFNSMVMCCACQPYAPPTPSPTPIPSPMEKAVDHILGLIDGAASQRLSALAVIVIAALVVRE